jgi:hypothetical protein
MTFVQQMDHLPRRYGHPIYEVNPSLPGDLLVKENLRLVSVSTINDDGITQSSGSLGAAEELDQEKCVKFYLKGILQYSQLSKPGIKLFEFIYDQLSNHDIQNKDLISLNYVLARKWDPTLNRRTYSRGVADLLEKEFLFRSMVHDLYFVNVQFVFNGDRVALVRSYQALGQR